MTGVIVNYKNNYGVITLNDPSIHNALKKEDINVIREALFKWRNQELDAIIITGTGKSFCSGLFLEEFDYKVWDKNPITLICEDIENFKCPVICALNGGAYGGAVEIALSCDFRVVNRKLTLMVPAGRLGIHYESSGLRRALNTLGPSLTRRLFLLGEVIPFEDILKTNFIDFCVGEGETVKNKSLKLVESLSKNSPLAVSGMKKTIIEILNNSLNAEAAAIRVRDCFNSDDHKDALLAIKGKREPKPKDF
ncbi:MAG: hypothetical protein CML86_06180 [Rhodobiaceae bacterium]|nr:hypothetical protein [Rhodobiaceae bacterium]